MKKNYKKRIGYKGDLKLILKEVCSAYDLGVYKSHKIFTFGYEDFNLHITTTRSNFFVKILATFRSLEGCKRYAFILEEVLKAGVHHPKLLKTEGEILYQTIMNGVNLRLFVMEYIDGSNLFETKSRLNKAAMKDIVQQAARINTIKIKPAFEFDSWAITSFLTEFEKNKQLLDKEDLDLIEPLANEFKQFPIKDLPHCFVHGDIIKTNVVKSKKGELYILDFAVSNYYPRIIELAILLCDMVFDTDTLESFPIYYKFALNEYQKFIKLTAKEIESLPLFLKIAHAMHVIPATREKVLNKNISEENMYWLNTGKIGLQYTSKIFNS